MAYNPNANVRRALPSFSTAGWVNHGNFFSVEASQLPSFRLGRVWDDACDEGCFFESHKSGKKVVFTLVKREESEGDVAGWHLESFGIPQKLKVLVVNT